MSTLTADELRSARAIRATMKPNGSLDPKRFDDFRAANRTSRDQHGDDRHEVVKSCATHASVEKIDLMLIRALVAQGDEHLAREQYGDAAVDAVFVADGWDVEACR